MTPKSKALHKAKVIGGFTDEKGIRHLSESEQKAKTGNWPKGKPLSRKEFHKEMSQGDTFEGEARMKKHG